MDNNRIEKVTLLNAPLERVWAAISDSAQFGTWFGAEFDGPFVEGRSTTGRIVPTSVDAEVAAAQEPHRGAPLALQVVAVEPMTRFVFQWKGSLESDVATTVTFRLDPVGAGVRLSITESGFEGLPEQLRAATRDGNAAGWEAQLGLVASYLEHA